MTCCATDRNIDLNDRNTCAWTTDEPGYNIPCTSGQASYGRCATVTEDNMNSDGDCVDPSIQPYPGMAKGHSVQCCMTTAMVDDMKCGWIYGSHGVTVTCPISRPIAAGFCGTAAVDLCQNSNTFGVRCCSLM